MIGDGQGVNYITFNETLIIDPTINNRFVAAVVVAVVVVGHVTDVANGLRVNDGMTVYNASK